MAQVIHLYAAPARRLPVTALTAAGLLVALLLSAVLLPQGDIAPDMAWRGNSGSLEALR